MNESDTIATLLAHVPTLPSPLGPGDDAATLSPERRVISADALAEGVHFKRSHPPEWLGWKALAVNLSDINAMGARPEAFVLSVALPEGTLRPWWERFAAGLGQYASRTGTHLAGGDVIRSTGPIFIAITAWGRPSSDGILQRSGGNVGDSLMLAGQIGASGEGLRRWLDQAREGFWTGPLPEADEGILGHLRPDPPLWAGPRALGEGATAAIDLSDGLATDIENLARACGLRIDLDLEDLPVAECARALDDETLVSAGEDYALALLVPSELTKRFEGLGFVCVGRASTGEPGVHFLRDGHPLNLRTSPFEHFES